MEILTAGICCLGYVICCIHPDPSSDDVYPPLLPNEPAQQRWQRPPHTGTHQPRPISPWVLPPPPASNETAQQQQEWPPHTGTLQPRPIAPLALPPPPVSNEPAQQQPQWQPHTGSLQPRPISPWVLPPPPASNETAQQQQEWPPLTGTLQPRHAAQLAPPPPCRHEGRPTGPSVSQPSRGHGDRSEQRRERAQHAHSTRRRRSDLNNADQASAHSARLRARAKAEYRAKEKAKQERRKAEQDGNAPLSEQLWNKVQEHKAEMQRLNAEAAELIFDTNNRDRTPGEVDVHGLHVQEAIKCAKPAVEEAKARGQSELRIIVGKGLHSEGREAKLKPAILKFLQEQQPAGAVKLDPSNSGVIIVNLVNHNRDTANILRPVNLEGGVYDQDPW
ncbi:hypothetical protein PsYK624_062340 [Phanerochaete sordida]|uniref:Smr domain-containing protein n=1 Tax=Phanerochaete sordida TaxID=48140 RepID=A0A9P3G888_9APHY|nr:hypothetical protein PsYK624_062340 [Phanerochaete sordida]